MHRVLDVSDASFASHAALVARGRGDVISFTCVKVLPLCRAPLGLPLQGQADQVYYFRTLSGESFSLTFDDGVLVQTVQQR
jgi:hypothetical protein